VAPTHTEAPLAGDDKEGVFHPKSWNCMEKYNNKEAKIILRFIILFNI
jgi:hypothetical protein